MNVSIDMNVMRWQDRLTAMLGGWLLVSPMLLGYGDALMPTRNAVLVGILIMIVAVEALDVPAMWEEAINILLGVWLMVSPFLARFRGPLDATFNSLSVGFLVTLLAVWAMLRDQDFQHWRQRHRPHA